MPPHRPPTSGRRGRGVGRGGRGSHLTRTAAGPHPAGFQRYWRRAGTEETDAGVLTDTPEVQRLLSRAAGLDQPGGNERLKRILHRVATDMCRTIEEFDVTPPSSGPQ